MASELPAFLSATLAAFRSALNASILAFISVSGCIHRSVIGPSGKCEAPYRTRDNVFNLEGDAVEWIVRITEKMRSNRRTVDSHARSWEDYGVFHQIVDQRI